MLIMMGHSASYADYMEGHHSCGVWTTQPFTNWRNALKECNHIDGDSHLAAIQTAGAYEASQLTGSVVRQIQNVAEQEQLTNRVAVRVFFCYAHFLTHQHISQTTNFEK